MARFRLPDLLQHLGAQSLSANPAAQEDGGIALKSSRAAKFVPVLRVWKRLYTYNIEVFCDKIQ